MPAPPPLPDPLHIETRLLIVTEMLAKAIAEVQHVVADINAEPQRQSDAVAGPEPDALTGPEQERT